MSHLKTLGSVVVLVLALGIPVAAGETSSPCAAPGQIDTPPCASAPASSADEVLPETPSLSDSVDIYTLAEIALERLLLF